jgi:hypothetical protein
MVGIETGRGTRPDAQFHRPVLARVQFDFLERGELATLARKRPGGCNETVRADAKHLGCLAEPDLRLIEEKAHGPENTNASGVISKRKNNQNNV